MNPEVFAQFGMAALFCVVLGRYVAHLVQKYREDAISRERLLSDRLSALETEFRDTLRGLVLEATNTSRAVVRELRTRPCLAQTDLDTALVYNGKKS
jgi:hypothetical protein